MPRVAFTVLSELAAPVQPVWKHIRTLRGVNEELMPIVRMTGPVDYRFDDDTEFVPGAVLIRSWLLLFGFLPVDRHNLALDSIEAPLGFHERSTSFFQKEWLHVRRLESRPGGCVISDHVVFSPRLPFMVGILEPVYKRVFQHRHRRLRRKFGARQD